MEEEIQELVEELGAKKYKEGISWKGYKVYIPQYKGHPCIGLPYVVLVKNGEVRLSTPKESEEYLLFRIDEEEKGQDKLKVSKKKFTD